MKNILLLITFLVPLITFSQLVKIKGYAPEYIGADVSLYSIEDYFTNTESRIAQAKVGTDSVFTLNFYFHSTEKVRLKVGNNFAYLYLQPDSDYEIYFPGQNKYDPIHPEGSEMELLFRSLPKSDINYKILEFDRWLSEFIGENYHTKSMKQGDFAQKLDTLKMNMEKYYAQDTSTFFKTIIKFRFAELDEASYYGSRNELEKFDHYLLYSAVHYKNDAYMSYIKKFYKEFFERTTMELNNRVYLAVLKASPTMLFNALGQDYRMKNLRLRELIMVKSLGEIYYNADYPQTNITVMLDSITNHALFENNKVIAKNIKNKLTELVPGSPAPRFTLFDFDETEFSITKFPGKYKYIQFITSDGVTGKNEMELMKPLYKKYGNYIEFVTVFIGERDTEIIKQKNKLNDVEWSLSIPKNEEDLKLLFGLRTFPHYVLIDPDGFIVASPAQRPSPDGQYETIDKTFFEIHKVMMNIPE